MKLGYTGHSFVHGPTVVELGFEPGQPGPSLSLATTLLPLSNAILYKV